MTTTAANVRRSWVREMDFSWEAIRRPAKARAYALRSRLAELSDPEVDLPRRIPGALPLEGDATRSASSA
jgi:hypothetical protein